MAESKWARYNDSIETYQEFIEDWGYNKTARKILEESGTPYDDYDVDTFRTYIKRYLKRLEVNDYSDNRNNSGYKSINNKNQENTEDAGTRVSPEDPIPPGLEAYCKHYNIDIKSVKSWKFVNHQGQAAYNIVGFNQEEMKATTDWEEVKEYIKEGLSDLEYNLETRTGRGKVGVLKVSDLHLGAYVDDLIRSRKFSIGTLVEYFKETVEIVNSHEYDTVHVHILGDLIESFTGLNHLNSWKNLGKGMFGAEAVKLVSRILHEALLSKIINLGEVKIVAGNHDRVTSKNDEDVQGDAANLVTWGLELLGYDVEFNPLIITHVVGDIAHILTHGHHGISKMTTKELIWDYGVKGKFNYVCEGHLHSRIGKLASKKNFTSLKDDAVDHRRYILPSYFTGNFYSESNGWTSTPGFVIVEDNGRGVPNTFDYSL